MRASLLNRLWGRRDAAAAPPPALPDDAGAGARSIGARHEIPAFADGHIERWWPQNGDTGQLVRYLPVLLRAVLAKSLAMAEVPLYVQRAHDEAAPRRYDHPALKLLAQPQPAAGGVLDGASLRLIQLLQVQLRGESFALRDTDGSYWATSRPLRARYGRGQLLEAWLSEASDRLRYAPDDVLWLRMPDGLAPYGHGFNVIQTMRQRLETYLFSAEADKRMQQRGGTPPTMFASDRPIERTALAKLENDLREQYGGYENRDKWLVLTGGLKPVKLGQTAQEAELSERDRQMIVLICGCVGIPPALAGFPSIAQHADLAGLERSFYTLTVDNELNPLLGQLTRHWQRRGELRRDEQLHADIDAVLYSILPLDRRGITAQRMLETGATPNEVRRKIWGLPPSAQAGMDQCYRRGNLVPFADDGGGTTAPARSGSAGASPSPGASPSQAADALALARRALAAAKLHRSLRTLKQNLSNDLLAGEISRVQGALADLAARIRGRANDDAALGDAAALVPAQENESYLDDRREALQALVVAGYGLGTEKLQRARHAHGGVPPLGMAPSGEHPRRALDNPDDYVERIGRQVRGVPDSIRDEIAALIRDVLATDGPTPGDLRQALDRYIRDDLMGRARADRIAQTEIGMALMVGQAAAFAEAGADKEWMAGPDSAAWDRRHDLLDGSVLPADAAWTTPLGNLARHPMDPDLPAEDVVYCQCDILPVIGGES